MESLSLSNLLNRVQAFVIENPQNKEVLAAIAKAQKEQKKQKLIKNDSSTIKQLN